MSGLDALSDLLAGAVERGVFPGAVARVGLGGDLLLEEAVGMRALEPNPAHAAADTVYDVASLTKVAATASAACILSGMGKLDLDEPVGARLDGWPEDKRAVTVRHLLGHTSGFPGWKAYGRMWLEEHDLKGHMARPSAESRSWMLSAMTGDDLFYEPGSSFLYSDPGFIVLWELLERVASEPLDAFLGRELFRPLGMDSTFFVDLARGCSPPVEAARIAPTEDCPVRGRVLLGEVHDLNAWALGGFSGHAGLFSTAGDLHRLGAAWLASLGGGGPFPPEAASEFFTLHRPDLQSPFALGWDSPAREGSLAGSRMGPAARGHWGYTGCSLWLEPGRGLVVVLLSNRVHPHDTPPEAMAAFRPRFHDASVAAAEELMR